MMRPVMGALNSRCAVECFIHDHFSNVDFRPMGENSVEVSV